MTHNIITNAIQYKYVRTLYMCKCACVCVFNLNFKAAKIQFITIVGFGVRSLPPLVSSGYSFNFKFCAHRTVVNMRNTHWRERWNLVPIRTDIHTYTQHNNSIAHKLVQFPLLHAHIQLVATDMFLMLFHFFDSFSLSLLHKLKPLTVLFAMLFLIRLAIQRYFRIGLIKPISVRIFPF